MTPSRKGPIESHLGLEEPAKSATFLARDQKGRKRTSSQTTTLISETF